METEDRGRRVDCMWCQKYAIGFVKNHEEMIDLMNSHALEMGHNEWFGDDNG